MTAQESYATEQAENLPSIGTPLTSPPSKFQDPDIADAASAAIALLRTIADRWNLRVKAGRLDRHPITEAKELVRLLHEAACLVEGAPDVSPDASPATAPAPHAAAKDDDRFRLLIDSVTDYAIFVLDKDGRISSWNPGAERINGYRADEIIGRHFSIFYTKEDLDIGKPIHELEIASRQGRYAEEGWRVRKNGEIFWASVTITALRDPLTRELRGFAKVTRDLSDRRLADELLRRSEERLRLLVESVKDYAIFMLDPEGRIATWNSGAEQIHGYRADEVLGTHFSIFYPPDERSSGRPERELEIAATQGRYEEEGWRWRKSGERFWANVILTAVHDPSSGKVRGFAKVTRDLTERKLMEEQARVAAEEAMRERARALEAQLALSQRDEFISVAAHELRTPLQALQLKVQSAAHSLKKLATDPSTPSSRPAERIDGALLQISRLAELIERLLDVSRIVRGSLVPNLEETDFSAVVGQVVDDLAESARHAGSELRFDDPGPIVGMWDRLRLEQVVVNLLSNAIKYGNGKPIEVRLEGVNGHARLSVRDHGIGISEDDVERIFSRFERAAPVRHYAGLGLGLYITRNIVEAHGGTIQVDSRLGAGSTFVVELPRRPSTNAPLHGSETNP